MRNNHTTNSNTIKILLNNNKLSKYNILFDYIQKKKKQETQQNKMRLKRRVKGSNSRRKMKQPPPSPKAVKASPSKRQTPAGVQVSLPLGSIKNFQHLHNAPLSQYSTQAVASPSPKAQKMRKRVVEQKPASSNNNNFENNFFPEPPMKSAVQNARHHSRMASTRLQEKQAKLAAFQKRIKARVSNRVKKEKQTAMKQRQAWVNLENKAESSARRVAQGVKNTLKTNRSMVTYSKTPSLKKSTKLTLDEHIVNVTANTQAARLALFAHSKQGKLAMKQAVQPHLNVPAFSMGAAINNKDATVVGENESPMDDSMDENNDSSRQVDKDFNIENNGDDYVPGNGGKWRPNISFATAKTEGFDTHNVDRASAQNLVYKVRKAEMKAQRESARRTMELKKMKERRAKKEKQIEAQRKAHEEKIAEMRTVNEHERSVAAELEKTQSESLESARKSQALKAQRQRETATRYITALRQRLLYQLKEKNMEVPPLCSCADSMGALESGKPIWDSCANNCQFRNNPKDVKRIVSDLVRSVKYSLA